MADKRDHEDDRFEYSETGYDYWSRWYSYPPYGYYPYGARPNPQSRSWSQAQCGSQIAVLNPDDHDGSETDSEDENTDGASLSQKVRKPMMGCLRLGTNDTNCALIRNCLCNL